MSARLPRKAYLARANPPRLLRVTTRTVWREAINSELASQRANGSTMEEDGGNCRAEGVSREKYPWKAGRRSSRSRRNQIEKAAARSRKMKEERRSLLDQGMNTAAGSARGGGVVVGAVAATSFRVGFAASGLLPPFMLGFSNPVLKMCPVGSALADAFRGGPRGWKPGFVYEVRENASAKADPTGRPELKCRVGVLAHRPQTLRAAMVGEYTHPTN